jgi:CRP-like cAMP-binding protein
VQVRLTPATAPDRRSEPPPALPATDGESLWFKLQRIFGRKGVEHAVRKKGVAADGTVILSDMPVDMRPDERILLEAGEIFGEMSALSRYPVSADVIAETDVVCLLIRYAGAARDVRHRKTWRTSRSSSTNGIAPEACRITSAASSCSPRSTSG